VAKKRAHLKAALSPEARNDLRDALRWSETKFGHDASLRYAALMVQAIRDITEDPARQGSRERPELLIQGARTYHIQFSRHRAKTGRGVVHHPRHFILYRCSAGSNRIEIGRILYDSRDLELHLPGSFRRTESDT
jgi:toxin ParE1/3/4